MNYGGRTSAIIPYMVIARGIETISCLGHLEYVAL
jgi:hypothetical protein